MMKRTNSQKILKSVALTAALTAAGTVATTTAAHADEVAPNNAQSTASTTDNQLATLKSQQAASESTMANSNAQEMSAATATANSQVADLNSQIATKQASDAAVHQAQVASQTAAINQAAKTATDAENASYSQAVASQTAANDAQLKSAQATIVTEQQKAQQTAQENADFQNQAGNMDTAHNQALDKMDQDAESDTAQTKAALQSALNKQAQAYNQKVADATKQVDQEISDANNTLNAAQDTVNKDGETLNAKKAANNAAQEAAKSAQTKLQNSQAQLKAAQDDLNNGAVETTDTLQVPQDYINVWKEYYQNIHSWDLTKEKNPDLWERNHNASIEAKKLNNDNERFHASSVDQNTPISLNADGTLSREAVIIATQYAAELLNPIREAIGVNPIKISNASISITMENASKYRAKGHNDWKDSHDESIMKEISKEWGCDDIGESLSGNYSLARTKNPSVADLKKAVYNAVIALLFEGSGKNTDNGHTTDLLGVRYTMNNTYLSGSDFLGITYDLDPVNHNGWIRFNSIGDGNSARFKKMHKEGYGFTAGTDKDKTIQGDNYTQIAVPTPGEATKKLEEKIANLKQTVATDTQAATDAQNKANTTASELKAAQDQLLKDSTAVSQAQAKLEELKSSRDTKIKQLAGSQEDSQEVKDLRAKLNQIKEHHVANVKAENDQYEAKLADLKSKHEARLAAIAAQPTSLAELQSQLQAKLDALKTKHEANLKAINDDTNTKLNAVKNSPVASDPEIAKLQSQIDQIKDALAKKQQELDTNLANLKAKNQNDYNALATKLNHTDKAVVKGDSNTYTTKDGKTVVLKGDDTKAATTSETTVSAESKVSAPVVSTKKTTSGFGNTGNASVEMTREEYKAQQAKLPQTGNTNSTALVALGAIASMFGLGLAAKKRY